MKHPESRATVALQQARLIKHVAYDGQQYYMRLEAPLIAATARPGSFVHLQCDSSLMMRRPMSIMRADKNDGWIELLYKVHGVGTERLSQRKIGEIIDMMGPIGVPFKMANYKRFPLLIGGGVGLPPMIFLAEHIRAVGQQIRPLVLIGSEVPFPFFVQPSKMMLNGMPTEVIAAMRLLEDWGIPSRLASSQGYAGCYVGHVTELARHWLAGLDQDGLSQVEIFSCGPTPMLKAVSELAHDYGLACQVSLEEHMACAVGGCAGCNVLVETAHGQSMQRICVDGPVFEAQAVFPSGRSAGDS